MSDEHLVLDGHALADETMRGYLAARADLGADLDFDKGADPRVVTNLASVQIHDIRMKDPHIAAELDVLRYGHLNSYPFSIHVRKKPRPPDATAEAAAQLRRGPLPHDKGDERADAR